MPELYCQRKCNHSYCTLKECEERYWYLTNEEVTNISCLVEEAMRSGAVSLTKIATRLCRRDQDVRKEDIQTVVERTKQLLATQRWFDNQC